MTTPRASLLRNLARTLDLTAHQERHADDGCPQCRATTWDTTGYPSSTMGDAIRSADHTSSTERGALTLTPALTYRTRLDAALNALDTAAVTVHNILVELGYDPTNPQAKASLDDKVAVGRGNCLNCYKFCIGDGETQRLRAGLCHTCYGRLLRRRAKNPGLTVTDFCRGVPA